MGDKPDACPACGGPPVESPVGWVCADCDAWIGTIDTRDDVDAGGSDRD